MADLFCAKIGVIFPYKRARAGNVLEDNHSHRARELVTAPEIPVSIKQDRETAAAVYRKPT